MVNAKVENASAVPVSLEKIAVRNIVQQIVTEKVFVKTGPVNVLMDMKVYHAIANHVQLVVSQKDAALVKLVIPWRGHTKATHRANEGAGSLETRRLA